MANTIYLNPLTITLANLLFNSWTSPYTDITRKGQKESSRIKLSLKVKKAIIASLKTNEKQLNNGENSLERNGVKNELSWACRLETQTHVIMVWHIATCLCEINWEQANLQRESEHIIVATALSKLVFNPCKCTGFLFKKFYNFVIVFL